MNKNKLHLAAATLSLLLAACSPGAKDEEIPLMFFNGNILTMQGEQPESVEAVVIRDGRILFAGEVKEAEATYGNAHKRDLEGKTLLPGFIDPHSHFGFVSNSMGQLNLNPPPMGEITSIEDIQKQLKEYKEKNQIADGEWIFAWGYDESQLKEKRHPDKKEIDEVLPNNPVYLQHASGHMGVANSLALKELKVDATTPNPEGGNIDRYPRSSEPNGLVQETAMYPFAGNMLMILKKHADEYFDKTQRLYAENGYTTVQDGMTDRPGLDFYRSQAEKGKLIVDLVALAGVSDLQENLSDTTIHWKKYINRFKVQGTKIVSDGSPQGKTAFFTQPYLTSVPGCTHNCCGLPSISQEMLDSLFLLAYQHDNQLFIHCNGDASIDMILTAHERACKALDKPLDADRRTIMVHSQFVRKDQLESYRKYHIEPSFFTNHAYFWGDAHVENLGTERAFFLSPIHTADEMGLKYTNHTDATVTPLDPLFVLWTATTRLSRNGQIIGEAERATTYQALKAITSHAAYELFEEQQKGSIEVGKLADFVILDRNPLEVKPEELKDLKILETIKEGVTIYSAKQ